MIVCVYKCLPVQNWFVISCVCVHVHMSIDISIYLCIYMHICRIAVSTTVQRVVAFMLGNLLHKIGLLRSFYVCTCRYVYIDICIYMYVV